MCLTQKNFHADHFSVQGKLYLRERPPAIVRRGGSKGAETRETGGSGIFHVPCQGGVTGVKGEQRDSHVSRGCRLRGVLAAPSPFS